MPDLIVLLHQLGDLRAPDRHRVLFIEPGGLAIADLPAVLRTAPLPSFADFSHLTDAGAAAVAGVLARIIGMVAARGCAAS